MELPTVSIRRYFPESWKNFIAYATITNRLILLAYFQWAILFFCAHFSFVKPSGFFLPTDDGITDGHIPSMDYSVKFSPTEC